MKTYSVIISLLLACGTAAIWWFFFREEIADYTSNHSVIPPTIEEPKTTYREKVEEEVKQAAIDTAHYNNAIQNTTPTWCDAIENSTLQSDCKDSVIIREAIKDNDAELCWTISKQDSQVKCRDALMLKKAEEKWDKTLCDSISESGSILYCQESIDAKTLKIAQENQTVSPLLCNSLSQKYREICTTWLTQMNEKQIQNDAIRDNNQEWCELLSLESEKQNCLDILYLKQAIVQKDANLCESITQGEKKDYCQKMFEKQNIAELFKEYIGTNNLEWCQTLSDLSLKNKCNDVVVVSLARINKDWKLCETLTNTWMITNCQKVAQ